ncbi:MAG TPA: YfhO family protein [Thermoanaerobaculia bacterium]
MGLVGYLAMAYVSIAIARRVFLPISFRASAALAILPLLFTFRAFVTGGIYAPIDLAYQTEPLVSYIDRFGVHAFHNSTLSDTYAQMLPWRAVVREAILSGEWPLINPYMLSGDLLAGSAQPAPYDPINLAGLLLPLADSINLTTTLAFLWAAIGAFLLARRFQMGEISALFAAAAWMASSFIVFFIEAALGHAALLLPLVCVAAIDVVRRPGAGRAIVLGIVLAVLIFAGHPEALLQVVVIGSIFGAYELWREREHRSRSVAAGVGGGILAVMLSAIFLLPILDALPQTTEFAARLTDGSEDLQTVSWKFSMVKLPVSVVPFVYGLPWKESGNAPPLMTPHNAAIGGVFLALAIAGALFSPRRERLFLVTLAAFGLLAGIGFPPLVRAFSYVPLLSLARNERFIAAAALSAVLLAAMGIEICVAGRKSRIAWTMLGTGAALLFLIIALTPVMRGVKLSEQFIRASSASLLVPVFVSGALLLAIRRVDVCIAALLVVALIQRVADVGAMYPTVAPSAFCREPSVLKSVRNKGLYRFAAEDYSLLPNIGAHYGVEDVRGFQAMSLLRLQETYPLWCTAQQNWFNRIDSLSSPFLSFLNVRYALHYPERPLPPQWRVIGNAGRLSVVENARALPRAFIPTSVRLNVPYPRNIREMRGASDFSAVSWVGESAFSQPMTNSNGSGKVVLARDGLSRYVMRADLLTDAWIVVSQPAWRGWRAFEGAQEIPTSIANHAFLAMRLARGHHDVALAFRPWSFLVGRMITLVTLIGISIFLPWSARSAS